MRNRNLLVHLVISVGILVLTLAMFSRFARFVENRPGALIDDPVLNLIAPREVSWLTFTLIYCALVTAVVSMLRQPFRLIVGVRAYSFMVAFRALTMFLLPLDPPARMITLRDPLIQHIGMGGQVITRDLFFSGHTATMWLLFLTATHPVLRRLFLAVAILVASGVLVQHVHYSVDVAAAPFFAYTSFRIAKRITPKAA